jgi:hypothetical protein
MKSLIAKRGVVVAGHKTTVSLELEFWNGLREIAGERDTTLSGLVTAIDSERQDGINCRPPFAWARALHACRCRASPFQNERGNNLQPAATCRRQRTRSSGVASLMIIPNAPLAAAMANSRAPTDAARNITRVHNGSDVAAARISSPGKPGMEISMSARSGDRLRMTSMQCVPSQQLATILKSFSARSTLIRPHENTGCRSTMRTLMQRTDTPELLHAYDKFLTSDLLT